jgi:hypothetical protein
MPRVILLRALQWDRTGVHAPGPEPVDVPQEILDSLPAGIYRPVFEPEALRTDGPTVEQWVAAGYRREHYPPEGYAEVDSPGLQALRSERRAAEKAAAIERVTGLAGAVGRTVSEQVH